MYPSGMRIVQPVASSIPDPSWLPTLHFDSECWPMGNVWNDELRNMIEVGQDFMSALVSKEIYSVSYILFFKSRANIFSRLCRLVHAGDI